MDNLEDVLQHFGIKGMKWGKRKSGDSSSGSKGQNGDSTVSKVKARVKEQASSLGRELSWAKTLRNVDNMSSKEINKIARRIQLENDLKRLTTSKPTTANLVRKVLGDKTLPSPKDKQDYRRRGKMSDAELTRKVERLRVKQNLGRQVSQASKEQIDFGKKVVKSFKERPVDREAVARKARDKVLRDAGFERMNR